MKLNLSINLILLFNDNWFSYVYQRVEYNPTDINW
jgi:hypothetical protein